MSLTAIDILSGLTEELGTLGEVPQAWIKHLTQQGGGDQSEIVLIKKGLRSVRDLSAQIKEGDRSQYAAFFLKKSSGEPLAIIRYRGDAGYGKPWEMIEASGAAVSRTVHTARVAKSWERKPVTYTDSNGVQQTHTPRHQMKYVDQKHTDVSLNDISVKIPFADGVDLYGFKKDVNRAAVHGQRQAARAGQDIDIDQLKKGVAGKFAAGKAAGPVGSLKSRLADITSKVQRKLELAVSDAEAGEYGGDNRSSLINSTEIDELNSLLYDLANLNSKVSKIGQQGARSGYDRGTSRRFGQAPSVNFKSYDYEEFLDQLQNVEKRLAKVSSEGGRYGQRESLAVASIVGEGGHKAGCTCNFCKNKGSFGKKKKGAKAEPKVESAIESLIK